MSLTARIFRFEVPVDEQWHTLDFPVMGRVVHVGCRDRHAVEFWAESYGHSSPRSFRVVGTGQPYDPDEGIYQGTAIVPEGDLVWHLLQRRLEP